MTIPRLSNEDRLVAIGMIEGGLSVREVARRMRCSPATISRLVQRNQETSSVRDRPRPGRQRVTTPAQDRYADCCVVQANRWGNRDQPTFTSWLQLHRKSGGTAVYLEADQV
ncbi:UNVERIFIED_CONTAM: hypothetical protein FKN15_020793 [Acipenser sinensis]